MIVPFTALFFGLINVCIALWAEAALHYEVDTAARCLSVQPTICTNITTTMTLHPYIGPSIPNTAGYPQVKSSASCNNEVLDSRTFTINAVVVQVPLTLTAFSCFPVQT